MSRKNWLFTASIKGADASASIFSLIETTKANRLSPFDYLEYILEIMPRIDIIQLTFLLLQYLYFFYNFLNQMNHPFQTFLYTLGLRKMLLLNHQI